MEEGTITPPRDIALVKKITPHFKIFIKKMERREGEGRLIVKLASLYGCCHLCIIQVLSLLLPLLGQIYGQQFVLTPPYFNIAENRLVISAPFYS